MTPINDEERNGDTTENNEEEFLSLMPTSDDDDNDDDDDDNDDDNGSRSNQQYEIRKAPTSSSEGGKRSDSYDKFNSLPPWMDDHVDYRRINPMVAFHNEIVSFCRLMEPKPKEMKTREELTANFTALAKSVFPDCKVEVFGSQATGLCLPTSDIDIAIQLNEKEQTVNGDNKTEKSNNTNNNKKANGNNNTQKQANSSNNKISKQQQEINDMVNWNEPTGSPLQLLARALREHWLDDLSYLEVIEKTRIPLVKFTHAPTNISIDVCFNQTSGVQAAALMRQYMQAIPPFRPLTFVLKQFLASRGLNQPYSGGVGSFLLQMMILAFLQHRERDAFNNRRPSIYNLGALLVEFFEFYSTDFNFILTGISVRFDGFFFPKGASDRKKNFWQPQRPFSVAMENPLDPTFDVGSASFRIDLVQRSFDVAFKVLLCHVSEPLIPTTSILATILTPSEEMWERSRPSSQKPQRNNDYIAGHGNGRQVMASPQQDEPAKKRQRRR
ncbi:MAG: non-canonical poly(A) RNA polymerase PAPD5/7 [Bacillariaceae sp.]|jgi:non-canonical poly(A) RNA polymerase PAPD5/7